MDKYINKYSRFNKKIIYNFRQGDGGIGDCIKYFMIILEVCIRNNIRLYYIKNNIAIEDYIKLRYTIMYIDADKIKNLENAEMVRPYNFYKIKEYNFSIDIKDVFLFSEEVILNSTYIFPQDITNYISIHLRLGDFYLETDPRYVVSKMDKRDFSEEKLYRYIEENKTKNIFFCCDNNNYRQQLKAKYNDIIISNSQIGHSSLFNTTKKQVLDAITELYILTKSETIYSASYSGFSIIASKFNNIPLIIT
jgi:hypothetical protein